jgi:hypothetical protein
MKRPDHSTASPTDLPPAFCDTSESILSSTLKPLLSQLPPELSRASRLILIDDTEIDQCPFWISSYESGSAECQSLIAQDRIHSILKNIDATGLQETDQIMLSKSDSENSFRILLLPQADISGLQVEQLISTIQAWPSERIGFHVSCHSKNDLDIEEFLTSTISRLLTVLPCREFLLAKSKRGQNLDLSLLAGIKRRLSNQGIEITIYH